VGLWNRNKEEDPLRSHAISVRASETSQEEAEEARKNLALEKVFSSTTLPSTDDVLLGVVVGYDYGDDLELDETVEAALRVAKEKALALGGDAIMNVKVIVSDGDFCVTCYADAVKRASSSSV
jgi:hypothetical protein